jgi:hypothetical protein
MRKPLIQIKQALRAMSFSALPTSRDPLQADQPGSGKTPRGDKGEPARTSEAAQWRVSQSAAVRWRKMSPWYVTYEVPKSGASVKRRSPRSTQSFETEAEAKTFARKKFDEGLIVSAGTINPHSPRRAIASGSIACWLDETPDPETPDPNGTQESEKR